uniref:Uncharacterized protein n=1 Tax=Opuntia streptacantha TaxID=393608 RepID=A0A7C9F8T2_OPUST
MVPLQLQTLLQIRRRSCIELQLCPNVGVNPLQCPRDLIEVLQGLVEYCTGHPWNYILFDDHPQNVDTHLIEFVSEPGVTHPRGSKGDDTNGEVRKISCGFMCI